VHLTHIFHFFLGFIFFPADPAPGAAPGAAPGGPPFSLAVPGTVGRAPPLAGRVSPLWPSLAPSRRSCISAPGRMPLPLDARIWRRRCSMSGRGKRVEAQHQKNKTNHGDPQAPTAATQGTTASTRTRPARRVSLGLTTLVDMMTPT
jgi:hypothetical protein